MTYREIINSVLLRLREEIITAETNIKKFIKE